MTQFQQLLDAVSEFKDELSQYLEKGATNASQAKRLRKASVQLGKDLKEFRTNSVAHHRKD
ncbi:hypothetical protein ZC03_014 [Pseudomonas phage ZC03]|uniref:Histone H1 n=1 Tax=Pseudomonas phage ZC03 TaxID=1622115 RepID=A0A1L2C922_9CAUD|nr:hypothetical protein HWA93_gp14 [Pseudomonas phage ZC03]AMD43401.1 hypothetical protein ZC03_014 [Pseudomonas phage ZC03]